MLAISISKSLDKLRVKRFLRTTPRGEAHWQNWATPIRKCVNLVHIQLRTEKKTELYFLQPQTLKQSFRGLNNLHLLGPPWLSFSGFKHLINIELFVFNLKNALCNSQVQMSVLEWQLSSNEHKPMQAHLPILKYHWTLASCFQRHFFV